MRATKNGAQHKSTARATLPPALLATFCVLLSACSQVPSTSQSSSIGELTPGSYEHARAVVNQQLAKTSNTSRARGIVLFVGDGMSLATVTASRIYAGQQLGKSGEEHQLYFESFPHVGLSKTYNTNQQTPDSAGTMTAMITGTKTLAGVLSVGPDIKRASSEYCNKSELKTLLQIAEEAGWATGVVTTTTVTHATPGATYAHSLDRHWESIDRMPAEAIEAGCRDIASQLLEFKYGDGIDVVLGGGLDHFTSGPGGKRNDGRSLVDEWQQKYPQGSFVKNKTELADIDPGNTAKLFGLFASGNMDFEYDRPLTEQPSLEQMASKALKILSQNENFILVVESGRIDHAHHYGNAFRALHETRAFDKTIETVAGQVDRDSTLMIVTADHSHTLTISGYPVRGNPILDFVVMTDKHGAPQEEYLLSARGKPFTTLGYANGFGHCDEYGNAPVEAFKPCAAGLKTDFLVDGEDHPTHANFQQHAGVPLFMETHGADDVPIYAQGPWAHLLDGVVEQNVIFHVMKHAAGL